MKILLCDARIDLYVEIFGGYEEYIDIVTEEHRKRKLSDAEKDEEMHKILILLSEDLYQGYLTPEKFAPIKKVKGKQYAKFSSTLDYTKLFSTLRPWETSGRFLSADLKPFNFLFVPVHPIQKYAEAPLKNVEKIDNVYYIGKHNVNATTVEFTEDGEVETAYSGRCYVFMSSSLSRKGIKEVVEKKVFGERRKEAKAFMLSCLSTC
jgi:hypothetical protein